MRMIDADKMAVVESEAYLYAQSRIKDEMTRSVNAVVHTKIQQLIADTPTVDAAEVLRGMWISVEERFPEEDGKYLVFEQNNGRTNTSILRFAKDARKVDRYDFKSRWENAWYEYDSEWGHYTVDSVTHWMPLPEMPKK